MRFKSNAKGDISVKLKFAWFPVTLKNGDKIWLEDFWEVSEYHVSPYDGGYWSLLGRFIEYEWSKDVYTRPTFCPVAPTLKTDIKPAKTKAQLYGVSEEDLKAIE